MNKDWCEGLSLKEWEEKHENNDKINMYLHGYCQTWAVMHFRKGDSIQCIMEDRSGKPGLMHCLLVRHNKYMDVRGTTDDFAEVLDGFDYGEYWVQNFDDLKEFNQFCKEMKLGLKQSFITEHIIRTMNNEDLMWLIESILVHEKGNGELAEKLVPFAMQLVENIGGPDYHLREALDDVEKMVLLEAATRYYNVLYYEYQHAPIVP